MMNRLKNKLRNQAGMTLLEITIIIIIIGVLAATVAVQYSNLSETAKVAKCKANQGALRSAVTVYWATNKEYPQLIGDLAIYMSQGVIPDCPGNGAYNLINENEIICTDPDHQ